MGKTVRIAALLLGAVGLAGAITWYGLSTRAEAACGASTSSCKTCHEIQGKDPVSKNGAWHTDHAAFDFCEFCHGGVTKETTAEKAHQGMRPALEDAQKSCATCHANDLAARVAKYGGSAPSGGAPAAGGTSPATNQNSGSATPPPPPAASAPAPAAPAGTQDVLDFNRRLPGEPQPPNRGNQVLWGLNALAALGLAGTYWMYEKKPRTRKDAAASRQSFADAVGMAMPAERAELVTLLAQCDASTLEALEQVLHQDGGPAMLRRLARLDLSLVGRLETLSREELLLVLSLARGQKN
ncbi:MAG: hypothetical protein ACM3ZA_08815 [Bacillota bacterium]